jgi:hypothetical protein
VPGNRGGESEAILGQWMKERGNRAGVIAYVIVATKLGSPMGEGMQGLSRRYMIQAVEDSLRRLQTDYIDLYQAHRDDQETPLEETMAAFDDLVKQGTVRWIGASNFTAARLAEANAVAKQGGWARYESIQPPYHLLQRSDYEAELELDAEAVEALDRASAPGGGWLMRVAIGGISHETNTFSTIETDLSLFERRGVHGGEELAAAFAGTRTILGGFLDAARSEGFEVVPTLVAEAAPSGTVTAAAFDTLTGQLVDGLRRAGPLDGVLMELHGAMVAANARDGDAEIL